MTGCNPKRLGCNKRRGCECCGCNAVDLQPLLLAPQRIQVKEVTGVTSKERVSGGKKALRGDGNLRQKNPMDVMDRLPMTG